jgi:hypothetical protein
MKLSSDRERWTDANSLLFCASSPIGSTFYAPGGRFGDEERHHPEYALVLVRSGNASAGGAGRAIYWR